MPNLAKFQNHLIQYACPGYLHKNEETNRLKKTTKERWWHYVLQNSRASKSLLKSPIRPIFKLSETLCLSSLHASIKKTMIRTERENGETPFSPFKVNGNACVPNSVEETLIWLNFKLIQALVPVLVPCKSERSNGVECLIWWNSNSSKKFACLHYLQIWKRSIQKWPIWPSIELILYLFSFPASMKNIWLKWTGKANSIFPIQTQWECSRATNSAAEIPILPNFELIQALKPFLVPCKTENDL